MPTTTNYGWTTPADTDLVKDGAAAIRTLGSSVDSTLKTQIDNTVASSIQKSIVDAKGDLITATAADTVSRLAVGSNNQVLTADSTTATGLKWATAASGGMTLISTTTLSGTLTTLSSIPQTYKSLYCVVFGMTADSSNNAFTLQPNGSTSLSAWTGTRGNSDGGANVVGGYNESISLVAGQATLRTSANNAWAFSIDNYTSSSGYKTFNVQGGFQGASSIFWFANLGGIYQSNSAITSLSFNYGGSNMNAGTVLLYGVS